MPGRKKVEAQLRMASGVTRVTALNGGSARDGLEALFKHLENVDALEHSHATQGDKETDPAEQKRISE